MMKSCVVRTWRHPLHWLAFAGGAGCAPRAPGTMGTLVAIPLYWLASHLPYNGLLLLTAAMFFAGIGICGWSARELGVHDHPGIVWDEVVGYFATMLAAPAGWPWWIAGFLLFRLFDIWKPWPIRLCDARVAGGFGIMLDDLLAAGYAGSILYGLGWWLG